MKMKKIPKDLSLFLNKLREEFINNFEKNLVGMYIYGSISYGDFKKHRSDIDIFVFVNKKISKKDIEVLKRIFDQPEIKNNYWFEKLEIDFIFIKDIESIKNVINTTCLRGGKLVNAKIEGLSMDLKNLLDCGIILYGPEPKTFIPKIKNNVLNEALGEKFIHIKENYPKWHKIDFWNQMYLTVQLCRIIYSIKNNDKVVSKKKATKWCSKNAPQEFRKMIKIALKGIDDWEKPINKEVGEKLSNLMNYTEDLLKKN